MSIRDDLKAYIDGELPPARLEEIRTAIENDPELLDEVTFLQTLSMEIKESAFEPEVVGLEATIACVRSAKERSWMKNPIAITLVGALCIFIVSVILFPVFSQAKQSARMSPGMADMKSASKSASPYSTAGDYEKAAPMTEKVPSMEGFSGKRKIVVQKHADTKSVEGERSQVNLESTGGPKVSGGASRADTKDGTVTLPDYGVAVPKATRRPTNNRMIVSNAQMSVQVENAQKAQAEAQTLAVGLGGYVESSNLMDLQGELPRSTVVMRVPFTSFDIAMQRIRKMGLLLNETTQSNDVTLQYTDSAVQLRQWRIEEDQYLTMLKGTRKMGEIMSLRDRLAEIRRQIDSLESQQKVLRDQAALSTITLEIEQRVAIGKPESKSTNWAEDTWASAVNGLSAVGRFLGRVAIFLFVFSPIWIVACILLWLAKKKAS